MLTRRFPALWSMFRAALIFFIFAPSLAIASDDINQAVATAQPAPPEHVRPSAVPGRSTTLRVAHVDLDYVYDPDPEQTRRNLDLLTQRIIDLGVNTVFLQAFADPTGDGLVRSLYFPNRSLPMRADLFAPAAQRLRDAAGVQVYAWMPVLSFDLAPELPRISRWDPALPGEQPLPDPTQYLRLSPFDATVRSQIEAIYEDLARHAKLDGLLFHDDALMSDFEDASPPALAAYADHGLPASIELLRASPDLSKQWVKLKTQVLTQLTLTLRDKVRAIQGPQVKTARNLFAWPILEPKSEAWFAQNLDDFLMHYDWTAPMAMPLMEGISPESSAQWLEGLVAQVARRPGALDKTVFELQSKDWSQPDSPSVDNALLTQWLQVLKSTGALSYGYYPDDFHKNAPDAATVRPYLITIDTP